MHYRYFLWGGGGFVAEEEEAEVKKSKFYHPATKSVPVSPHVAAVSSGENKKSVSLCSLFVTYHAAWQWNVGAACKK